jgi:hypothetical protein
MGDQLDPENLDRNVVYVGILQLMNLYYSIDAQRHYYLHFIVHVDPFTSHVGWPTIKPLHTGLHSKTSYVIDRPLDGHMHVCNSVALEETINELHTLKNLLFLETSSNDLHANRQTLHLVGIIADISILLNLVPWPQCMREFIERAIHARDGHNASGVVEL